MCPSDRPFRCGTGLGRFSRLRSLANWRYGADVLQIQVSLRIIAMSPGPLRLSIRAILSHVAPRSTASEDSRLLSLPVHRGATADSTTSSLPIFPPLIASPQRTFQPADAAPCVPGSMHAWPLAFHPPYLTCLRHPLLK